MIKSYNYSSLYKENMPYFYHILYCITAIFPFLNLLNSFLIFFFYIFRCLVPGCLSHPGNQRAKSIMSSLTFSKQKVRTIPNHINNAILYYIFETLILFKCCRSLNSLNCSKQCFSF